MDIYIHEGKEVTILSWWKTATKHLKLVDDMAAKLLKYKPVFDVAQTISLLG